MLSQSDRERVEIIPVRQLLWIDEHDATVDKAFPAGDYDDMVSLPCSMFGNALETNDSLYFAVLTGADKCCSTVARVGNSHNTKREYSFSVITPRTVLSFFTYLQ